MQLDIKNENLSAPALAYLIDKANRWGITPREAAARILDESAAKELKASQKKSRQTASTK